MRVTSFIDGTRGSKRPAQLFCGAKALLPRQRPAPSIPAAWSQNAGILRPAASARSRRPSLPLAPRGLLSVVDDRAFPRLKRHLLLLQGHETPADDPPLVLPVALGEAVHPEQEDEIR